MHRESQFIPELIVRDGPAALDFYKEVFGAEEVHRMMTPDNERLVHGELILDGHKLFVCDEFPASEGGTCKSPQTLGGTGVRVTLLVNDADRTVGHEWGVNQQLKEQTEDETRAAADKYFAKRK